MKYTGGRLHSQKKTLKIKFIENSCKSDQNILEQHQQNPMADLGLTTTVIEPQ